MRTFAALNFTQLQRHQACPTGAPTFNKCFMLSGLTVVFEKLLNLRTGYLSVEHFGGLPRPAKSAPALNTEVPEGAYEVRFVYSCRSADGVGETVPDPDVRSAVDTHRRARSTLRPRRPMGVSTTSSHTWRIYSFC